MKTRFARYGAAICLLTVGSMFASISGAAAAADPVQTVVRKSVVISADPSGAVQSKSMVTQLSSVGNGSQTVSVPIGTDKSRNLNTFGAPPTVGNNAVFNLNVNGSSDERIYTSADINPVTVKTHATLDGKPINPSDIVNKTGVLNVEYTVTNTTARTQTVTYKDAAGNDVSKDVVVADPLVGSVGITLPQGFNEISAPAAQIGGNGNNGNTLAYSLVMFEPLGKVVNTIAYQSRITNGTLPAASLTILPVVPYDVSAIKTAKDAFAGGVEAGDGIYTAGTELGSALDQLAAGIGLAITGINALNKGANELATQLNGFAPKVNELAAGVKTLDQGGAGLAAGIRLLQAGIKNDTLAATQQSAGYKAYLGGLQTLLASLGTFSDVLGLMTSQAGGLVTSAECTGTCKDTAGAIATEAGLLNTCINTGISGLCPVSAKAAVNELIGGLPLLVQGVATAIATSDAFNDPNPQKGLIAGSTLLAGGLATLDQQVNEPGTGLLALYTKAADGSQKLSDGLGKLAAAAPKLQQGVGEINTKAAGGLVTKGEEAQAGFALQVAQLEAAQAMGEAGAGIPYGKATGAQNTTGAYQIQLAAAANTQQQNIVRYLLALIALIVAVGVGTVIWRRHAAVG